MYNAESVLTLQSYEHRSDAEKTEKRLLPLRKQPALYGLNGMVFINHVDAQCAVMTFYLYEVFAVAPAVI